MVAIKEQLLLAQERAERAEHEAEYFAAMAQEIAANSHLDDALAQIDAQSGDEVVACSQQ
jgi:hypothetical protein